MEQIGDGKIGPWTDMYGLGAVMWRMVAGGNPPFSPLNPTTVQKRAYAMVQCQSDPLPTATEIGKGRFSAEILQAIDRCLIIDENKRTQSCAELLGELEPSVGNAEGEKNQLNSLGNKENLLSEPSIGSIRGEVLKVDSAKKSNGCILTILAVFGIIILLVVAINLQLEIPNPDLDQTSLITQDEHRLTGLQMGSSLWFSPQMVLNWPLHQVTKPFGCGNNVT